MKKQFLIWSRCCGGETSETFTRSYFTSQKVTINALPNFSFCAHPERFTKLLTSFIRVSFEFTELISQREYHQITSLTDSRDTVDTRAVFLTRAGVSLVVSHLILRALARDYRTCLSVNNLQRTTLQSRLTKDEKTRRYCFYWAVNLRTRANEVVCL